MSSSSTLLRRLLSAFKLASRSSNAASSTIDGFGSSGSAGTSSVEAMETPWGACISVSGRAVCCCTPALSSPSSPRSFERWRYPVLPLDFLERLLALDCFPGLACMPVDSVGSEPCHARCDKILEAGAIEFPGTTAMVTQCIDRAHFGRFTV